MGFVACGVSHANLSKIQPGKAREIKTPDTAALKYWLGYRQPDRWREQQEADGGGHDDALDRLIKAQDEPVAGRMEKPCLLIWNGLFCWLTFRRLWKPGV